jgi:hypothetical protein
VDKRPKPDFVKAYMHNGYLKSLKEVVHFYNTRDTLGACQMAHDPGEKVTCWPSPEVPLNVNKTIGRLGLTDREEDQIVEAKRHRRAAGSGCSVLKLTESHSRCLHQTHRDQMGL